MNQKAIDIINACWDKQDPELNLSGLRLPKKLTDADFAPGSELRRKLAMCTHIKTLSLEHNELGEIRGLEGLSSLQQLYLFDNEICEVQGLEGLSSLQLLHLNSNQVSEIRGLEGLSSLQQLDLRSNQINEIRGLEGLSSLQQLNISNNQISETRGLEGLSSLKELRLYNNRISKIHGLEGLLSLWSLDLESNQISEILGLDRLSSLQHLKIGGNYIREIRGLEGLSSLQELRLFNNQIKEIRGLGGLSSLRQLDLAFNQISEIRGLEGLLSLQQLDLTSNQISEIRGLEGLLSLQELHLASNQISKIRGLERLSSLQQLNIAGNQIQKICGLERLSSLQQLNIGGNQIQKICGLEKLSSLRYLHLYNNQISETSGLEHLTDLEVLDISNNNVSDINGLLPWLTRTINPLRIELKDYILNVKRGDLNVYGNPLTTPPMEVVQRGNEAVIEYLEAALKKNLQPLNECKVIIVGDGAVGKTSLMKRVVYNSFDPDEPTTHGINKIAWRDIYNAKGENITVNVWDFGGQHLQHSLHQFFFSKRVLYILVLNPRTMGNAAYWMGQVEKLGGDSQVLVVFNAKDEKDTEASFATSYYELCKTYQQLSETYFTVCCANDADTGIATFKQALTAAILAQPDLATQYPTDWYNIKKAIEEKVKLRQDNFYVHYDEYIKICLANNYPNADRQKGLLVQLDDIGSIVFFDRDDINHLQVLNPEWITTGAYAILTSAITHANNGYLTMADLSEIFKEEKAIFSDKEIKIKYETVHIRYILDLMQHYNLCQKNPFDTHSTSYLVPAALTGLPVADFSHYKQTGKHYRFEFDVKFEMIVIHRFIARNLNKAKDKEFWQSGIVIKDDNSETWALVETNQLSGVIDFWISGAEIRGFWEHIRRDMRAICKIYRNIKIEETVFYSKGGVEAFLSYEELLDYLKSDDGSLEARIRVPSHGVIKVDLLEVLENFESRESLEKMVREIREGIRIGFADSKEGLRKLSEENEMIMNLVKISQEESKAILTELLQKIDTALSNEQAAERLAALDAAINEQLANLPETIVTQWAALNSKANDGVEVKARLKLKVPIIPFLLDYEGETLVDMKKLGKKLRGIVF